MNATPIRAALFAAAFTGITGSAVAGTIPASCHAVLTPQDAREIALHLPNARAYAEGQHARLTTALAGRGAIDSVLVRVTAATLGVEPLEIGVYSVNLRTGAVLDDDQEPADDAAARLEEARLLARRCHR